MTNDLVPPPPSPSPPPYASMPPMAPPYATAPAPAPAAPIVQTTRLLAFALFGAAVITLIGVVTSHWFSAGGGEGNVGLTGIEACRHDRCMSLSWSEIEKMSRGMFHIPTDITMFAYLGYIAGIVAAVCTGVMGGMLLAGKARSIPTRAFNIVFGIAAFSMTSFVVRFYLENRKDLSFGWSSILAIGGLVATGVLSRRVVTARA